MFSYMFAHEAHHRGQAIMLAHQLGYKLPDKAGQGIWRWEMFEAVRFLRRGQGDWQIPANQHLFGNLIESAASEQTTGRCV
jgi:hypothetical protein